MFVFRGNIVGLFTKCVWMCFFPKVRLFRPRHNVARMNVSAARACLPQVCHHLGAESTMLTAIVMWRDVMLISCWNILTHNTSFPISCWFPPDPWAGLLGGVETAGWPGAGLGGGSSSYWLRFFVTDIQNIYENIISIPCDLKNDFKTLTYFRCLLSQTLPSTSGPPWLVCPVIMAQYSVVNIVGRMHTSPPRTDKPPSYTCFVLVGTEACFGVRPSSSALFFILLSPVQFLHI